MASMVALSKIRIPNNIRTIDGVTDLRETMLSEFPLDEKAKILQLAESIKEHGLLQPLVVKDLGRGNFRLIAGFRRYKAVQYNGMRSVDVKSIKGKTEDEIVLKLVENIHRQDLNPLDIANGLEEIKRVKGLRKQSALASLIHKSQGWVSQYLSLLDVDDAVKQKILSGEMGMTAARTVSALSKDEQAEAIKKAEEEAEAAGKKKVTTKGVRRQVAKSKDKKKKKQVEMKTVSEREKEQKEVLVKDFLDVHFGDQMISTEAKDLVIAFWDYLMSKDRLYIEK